MFGHKIFGTRVGKYVGDGLSAVSVVRVVTVVVSQSGMEERL